MNLDQFFQRCFDVMNTIFSVDLPSEVLKVGSFPSHYLQNTNLALTGYYLLGEASEEAAYKIKLSSY